jgi:hypothetical protein
MFYRNGSDPMTTKLADTERQAMFFPGAMATLVGRQAEKKHCSTRAIQPPSSSSICDVSHERHYPGTRHCRLKKSRCSFHGKSNYAEYLRYLLKTRV